MKNLKLKLIRHTLKPTYTEGELFNMNSNDSLFDTLEDTVRDRDGNGDLLGEDEGKVYANTAIPYGTYKLIVTWSNKFNRLMVLVVDVKHFIGIRLHWGATALQSAGCILGGKRIAPNRLKDTGYTDYMVNLVSQYDDVELEIV